MIFTNAAAQFCVVPNRIEIDFTCEFENTQPLSALHEFGECGVNSLLPFGVALNPNLCSNPHTACNWNRRVKKRTPLLE
jgi:hypothetical protein